VRVFAVVDDEEAVELFAREEDAQAFLADVAADDEELAASLRLRARRPRRLGRSGRTLGEHRQFVARPGDDPLELGEEIGVYGVVAGLERLDCLLAAGDQDSEQRDLLSLGADEPASRR
jgi:hypothetical protein